MATKEEQAGRGAHDHQCRIGSGAYVRFKSIADFALALAILPCALPLLGGIALAIRLDSAGPILFSQRRVGRSGTVFRMLKFRTMVDRPVDDRWEEAITEEGDWRVTRIGAFLRRSRLDELPQLFNILAGQMSWIGPRPEAEILVRWYSAEIAAYALRHSV